MSTPKLRTKLYTFHYCQKYIFPLKWYCILFFKKVCIFPELNSKREEDKSSYVRSDQGPPFFCLDRVCSHKTTEPNSIIWCRKYKNGKWSRFYFRSFFWLTREISYFDLCPQPRFDLLFRRIKTQTNTRFSHSLDVNFTLCFSNLYVL